MSMDFEPFYSLRSISVEQLNEQTRLNRKWLVIAKCSRVYWTRNFLL